MWGNGKLRKLLKKKKEKVRKVEWKNKRKSFSPKEQELQYILSFYPWCTHTLTHTTSQKHLYNKVMYCYVRTYYNNGSSWSDYNNARVCIWHDDGPMDDFSCAWAERWCVNTLWILGYLRVCAAMKRWHFTTKSIINRKATKSNNKSGFNIVTYSRIIRRKKSPVFPRKVRGLGYPPTFQYVK